MCQVGSLGGAWALLVPGEGGFVERALRAGNLLRRVGTRWNILCFVSSSLCPQSLNHLAAICDHVVVVVVREVAKPRDAAAADWNPLDQFLLDSMDTQLLAVFQRIAFLHPDLLILKQFDSILEGKGVLLDTKGEWSVVLMDPKSHVVSSRKQLCKKFVDDDGGDGWTKLFGPYDGTPPPPPTIPTLSDLPTLASLEKELILVKLNEGGSRTGTEDVLQPGGFWNELVTQKMYSAQLKTFFSTSVDDHHGYLKEGIAVVGMSARFPGANSLEEYWNILEGGRVTAGRPPLERNALCQLDASLAANFLDCRVDHFDAEFFGVAPSEAGFMDPQSRLVLEVSWEALEDAGIVPESLRGSSTGVFYGSWLQDYKELMNETSSPPTADYLRKYMGNGFGCGAAKLSFFYGLAGPNIATESGCSSSIVAVDLAVKSLARGECNLALATGVNLILQCNENKVIWAPDGKCKTFDAQADGYGRAEGVGVLVLKRYSDAVANNDRIYGLIVGSGVSQEGESVSFGAPTVKSEATAMKAALRAAGVSPSEVDHIEAHATGTAVGDPIEAAAIVEAYGNSVERTCPLYIASGKTNIGHTESCSGIAGIIKVLLSLEHETIPRHVSLSQLNPKINFEQLGGVIPTENVPWPRNSKRGRGRVAAVSSFGITGTDVHMILREAPEPQANRPTLTCLEMTVPQPLCLSARSPAALEELTQSYSKFLDRGENNKNGKTSLMDIAYTTTACRAMHSHRRVIIGGTTEELAENLRNRKWIDGTSSNSNHNNKTRSVAFTFPGIIGKMELAQARELYSSFPVFRMNMERCDRAFRAATTTHSQLLPILLDPSSELLSPRPIEWYAAVVAVQYSLAQLWISWGIKPAYVMGHCLGEIPAAMVAGVLLVEDGFKLVSAFSRFIELASGGGEMLAVRAGVGRVEQLIAAYMMKKGAAPPGAWLDVAVLNSPTQTVVAGEVATLQAFKSFCEEEGVKVQRVEADLPFHSRGIQPALEACREHIPTSCFRSPTIPYISSVTGGLLVQSTTDLNEEYWLNCFRHRVLFTSACHSASTLGIELFLEIGLDSSLSKLTAENVGERRGAGGSGDGRLPECIPSFDRAGGIAASLAALVALGVNIDWEGYYQFYPVSKGRLPHYPFQRKSFWFKRNNGTGGRGRGSGESEGTIIHPLLGGRVSLAKGQQCVTFEGSAGGTHPGAQFIEDHVIGTEVVFPAAGFLEIMLAGGIQHDELDSGGVAIRTTDNIVSIQDFHISAPLLVKSSSGGVGGGKMQTLIERGAQLMTEESKGIISVYSERGAYDWKLHASGEVAVVAATSREREPLANNSPFFQVPLDLEQIMERCSGREDNQNKFYQQMASVGLSLGEKFRSILSFQRNERETLAEVHCPSGNLEDYILHPILIDAMIQVYFIHKGYEQSGRLHVPVSVGKLVVIPSRIPPPETHHRFYVYCRQSEESSSCESQTLLLDQHGVVLALMEALVLATTSVEAVLEAGRLGAGSSNSPLETFEVVWEPAHHHPQLPLPPARGGTDEEVGLSSGICATLTSLHRPEMTEEEGDLDHAVNRLCRLYVLNMLYELGWEPEEVGVAFPLSDLISALKVKESLAPAFYRYLDFLVEDGFMKREEEEGSSWCTLKEALPPSQSVKKDIQDQLHLIRDYPVAKVISTCGDKLAPILQGEVSGQYILFGMEEPLAGTYYSNSRHRGVRDALTELVEELASEHKTKCSGNEAVVEPLRILEVGAGTGSFTRRVIPALVNMGLPFTYHFTDISASHFEKAKARFREHEDSMLYKSLDIERDPLEQGFPPNYFHLVVGLDVFHATSHLQRTIHNVRLLTRVGGTLLIGETDGPVREIDIIFGILSGYWLFQDRELRTRHCLVGADKWEGILRRAGFGAVSHALTAGGAKSVIMGRLTASTQPSPGRELGAPAPPHRWLLFGDHLTQDFLQGFVAKMRGVGRELIVEHDKLSIIQNERYLSDMFSTCGVEGDKSLEAVLCFVGRGVEEGEWETWRDRRELLRVLFVISKWIGQRMVSPAPRLLLVTTGTWLSGHEGDFLEGGGLDPSSATLWGLARNAKIEIPELSNSKSIDLDPGVGWRERLDALLTELWLDDKEPEVVHRQGARYVRRLKADDEQRKQNPRLDFRGNRFEVELPKSRAISDLNLVPKKVDTGELAGDQIEVEVRAASLNFRDVLTVMKPANSVFEQISIVGLDYSGIVTKVGPHAKRLAVGDPVYGLSLKESTIASHILTEESYGIRMPPGLTFSEAATLPAVFLTVWYSMVHVAKVQAGQVVLVHAVTGGVGLVAIQIAKLLGVELMGTAGSARKRNFARSLGLRHVFNSRDLTFGEKVEKVTGGAGVDMVLNCLTGPGFKEASMDLVKDGGHFVEISKLDIWSEVEAAGVRPHVHYTVIWLPDVEPPVIQQMMSKMNELVESGSLHPLPMTRFQVSHLPSAFSYLQRAKQLGKVIVEMPSWHVEERRFREQLFEGSSRSYLITGGMGAIGLAIAKWMVGQGARHVVLVGRSPPKPPVLETISQLNREFGANVICRQADISCYEQCRALLEDLAAVEDLPSLGGIHHAAGILSDKLLVNQSWAEFQSVLNSKVDGLYNLHRLSAHLPLQFFVAHSSMSSTFGNAGQSNYVAGNTYMDSLIAARNALGLPGLVVNWGQWRAGLAENVETGFTIPFSVQDGIAALERFLLENKRSVVAGRLRFPGVVKMHPPYAHTFLRNMVSEEKKLEQQQQVTSGCGGVAGEKVVPFMTKYKGQRAAGLTDEEGEAMITNFVKEIVSSILGLGLYEIEESTGFSSMGMDSLMSIDFTNKLQSELPMANVGYIDMEEFGSVEKMVGFISSLLSSS